MEALRIINQELSATMLKNRFELHDKLYHTRKEEKRHDLQNQIAAIDEWIKDAPREPNPDFPQEVIYELTSTITGLAAKKEKYTQEYIKDPLYFFEWLVTDDIQVSKQLEIYRRIVGDIQVLIEKDKRSWVCWLPDLFIEYYDTGIESILTGVRNYSYSTNPGSNLKELHSLSALACLLLDYSSFYTALSELRKVKAWVDKTHPIQTISTE